MTKGDNLIKQLFHSCLFDLHGMIVTSLALRVFNVDYLYLSPHIKFALLK